MNIRSGPLRLEIDHEMMVTQARLNHGESLLSGDPLSLLLIERHPRTAPALSTVYRGHDLNWRIIDSAPRRHAALGWTRDGSLEIEIELVRDDDVCWQAHVGVTNRADMPISRLAFTPLTAIPLMLENRLQVVIPDDEEGLPPLRGMTEGDEIVLDGERAAVAPGVDLLVDDLGICLACRGGDGIHRQLVIRRGSYDLGVWWQYRNPGCERDEHVMLPPFTIAGHDGGRDGGIECLRRLSRSCRQSAG